MPDGIEIRTDLAALMGLFASMRGLDVSVPVRNAARDFARGALKATPVAQLSRAVYYRAYIPPASRPMNWRRRRNGQVLFLPIREVDSYTIKTGKNAGRARGPKSKRYLRKVAIARGWSRHTWQGVFQALNMPFALSRPASVSPAAALKGTADEAKIPEGYKVTIEDEFRLDSFGRGQSGLPAVSKAGFAMAAANLAKGLDMAMRRAWHG